MSDFALSLHQSARIGILSHRIDCAADLVRIVLKDYVHGPGARHLLEQAVRELDEADERAKAYADEHYPVHPAKDAA